jgi:hypothetical protein
MILTEDDSPFSEEAFHGFGRIPPPSVGHRVSGINAYGTELVL